MTAVAPEPELSEGPGASIAVRRAEKSGGVVVTVTGVIGRSDAAVVSRVLHGEIDRGPTVIVVNVRGVTSCDRTGWDVLALAGERARSIGAGLHVVGSVAP